MASLISGYPVTQSILATLHLSPQTSCSVLEIWFKKKERKKERNKKGQKKTKCIFLSQDRTPASASQVTAMTTRLQ